jgi:DNA modification methylase
MTEQNPWPADQVERWPISRLTPYARNARTHSDEQIAQIAASIKEWGWTNPILVDEGGGIIAGHGRLVAAQRMGVEAVPVMVARGWTRSQKMAYILADNQLALNAGWNDELLKFELSDLSDLGFDLSLTGFAEHEIAALTAAGNPGLTDPDEAPEPPETPVSVLGDVWMLGRHRLCCGDSTDADCIEKLMQGKQADLCFTSPPYAQQRDYKSGGVPDWDALMQGVFSILPVKADAQVLVNLGLVHRDGEWIPYWDGWVNWMRSAGWRRFGWYVWDQGPGLPGDWNGRLAPSHEFIFHFNRVADRARKTKAKDPRNMKLKGGTGIRKADGSMSGISSPNAGLQPNKIPDSVIRVMRHKGSLGSAGSHPAPFPVDLPGEFVLAFSDPDDLLFEPFCGSGTTLIAAQKNGRSCYAIEIAPQYMDVAIRRWQSFAGQHATLDSSGRTFDEVAADRGIENAARTKTTANAPQTRARKSGKAGTQSCRAEAAAGNS